MNEVTEELELLSPFESTLEAINASVYNGDLTEIIEVTYAYRKYKNQPGIIYNRTLFEVYGGYTYDLFEDLPPSQEQLLIIE
jgi:ABC-type glycerol-3-phosphate transport system substrate-binding protein